jgi:hypothetical protein
MFGSSAFLGSTFATAPETLSKVTMGRYKLEDTQRPYHSHYLKPEIDKIPATVLELRVCFDKKFPGLVASQMTQFPPHLTKLTIDSQVNILPKDFSLLPGSLTYFKAKHEAWPNSYLKFLPAGLLHLSLPGCHQFTDACFLSLSPRLLTFKSSSHFTSDITGLAPKALYLVEAAVVSLKGALTEEELHKKRPIIRASINKGN